VVALPSVLFFWFLWIVPESPRWLVMKGCREEALHALDGLGDHDGDATVKEIETSLRQEQTQSQERFFQKKYAAPIWIAIAVASFNQFTGINAILYYAADIFRMAGAGEASALAQSVIVGLTNLVFTLIAMTVIDRLGRRKLLLVGAVGLTACLGLTAWGFSHEHGSSLVLACLIGYIAFFAFSQGAVIWVYLSEIFPNRVRARGQSLGTFTHWIWCAAISWSFPVIADYSKAGPFVFFAVMMVLQFAVVWRFFPETKGATLEEIQRQMRIT
jgi:sugar porter (SP) family MFS transporter